MGQSWQLQQHYETYLRKIRKVSEASIRHYEEALKWISKYLKGKGVVEESIYEVLQLDQLRIIRDELFSDPSFISLNKRGHQMYSVGMKHYIAFVEAADFKHIGNLVALMDEPVMPYSAITTEINTWNRSSIVREQVLSAADYQNSKKQAILSRRGVTFTPAVRAC